LPSIGSGPAGITIARKLSAAGIPVVIFEAGGADFTEESQAFYSGKTVGDYYFDLDITRLRYFGGSSNHWAGLVPGDGRHRLPAKILGAGQRLADPPHRHRSLSGRGPLYSRPEAVRAGPARLRRHSMGGTRQEPGGAFRPNGSAAKSRQANISRSC
jgi:choline dehydrogenase-like flavoprotein